MTPTNPVKTYVGLYAHVLKLTVRGIGRRFAYLLAGPFVLALLAVSEPLLAPMGFAGGLFASILRAAAVSLMLFAGRAIIEQRRLALDDFTAGLGAFFGDVMTVYFTLWIAGLLLGSVHVALAALVAFLAYAALPLFETVALAPAGGFATFGAAFGFLRRDPGPWLIGQLPVIALFATGLVAFSLLGSLLPARAEPLVYPIGLGLFTLVAFVYRGILFLTLDGTSPYQRAQKFGGAPSLR